MAIGFLANIEVIDAYIKISFDIVQVPPHDVAHPIAHALQVPDGTPVFVLHLTIWIRTRCAK